ncbi:uncharacterized protein BO97DRAFT_387765 [Aspergillus homomorphus CBS 101889]|uniref:Uncharacterized protein n=1 Tax=Aspergillus homomorphus (strain CBS 101889) TaxID=1450537 RepID=A0A395I0U6_ASPHC|nr:hypothetical protein BO97DRAFT_387765 [Aspergillus homomorphus CBS 101889]RAL13822.1 hypothetical protein BO97DRAFT_387765 [Aspergillus homomorphus CBS 101889]
MKSPEHVHDAQGSIASHKKEVVEGRETALNNVTDTRLGDCDVQLIDDLNRRLKWLSNQLSPGRRPYHFALLANHWLNTETWIVIDPPTRISIDARRRLGDPRFNDPYPAVDWTPRPKYPKTQRKTANVPKINSWRAAVNRNRKACGFDDVIKGVELFEGSADTPPDGKVDPACWILRKPPQGFSISSRQGTVFYEGGAGWQETLDDWQKVRRGYRIRKAIHEGRVNRKRAKEIALGITRYYRLSVPKVS